MTSDQASVDSRALLEGERGRLVAQLTELGFGREGETGLSYDANFADTSQVTAERGEAEALVGELRSALDDVQHALERLEDGTYGICEKCGRPIEPARLEAMPATRLCIEHASSAVGAVSTREDRLARFNRVGPFALVLIGGGIVLLVSLLRTHHISRFVIIYFVALVPTIILHEVSHGVVALAFGDDTAKRAGRLTLNPLRHVDPIGTILLPIFLLAIGAPAFGWAKPVPVSVNRLRHPRNEAVLVSLAGPATNLVLAVAGGLAFRLFFDTDSAIPPAAWGNIAYFVFIFGLVNVVIGVFNLIPIPPLDGSAILERFIPGSLIPGYYQLRRFAMLFILVLVFVAPSALDSLFTHAENVWSSALGLNVVFD